MTKMKRGFTVVELVVVIAVLAILVAVLIPTFSTLINKANLSKDTQLCRILNNEIAMGVDNQQLQEHATYHDVVEYLSPRYGIQYLTPTSSGDIVWDMNTNTFSLIDGGKFVYAGSNKTEASFKKNGVNLNLWKVVTSIPSTDDQKFSLYLADKANVQTVSVVVGFDAGDNTSVQNVIYDTTDVQNAASQNVIIRTNSYTTNVTINTEGSVKHYGNVGKLDIVKVAMASYHEFGNARTVALNEGNFVIENTGAVTLVSVVATAPNAVKLDIKGDLDVLAGDATLYNVTSGTPTDVVDAPIDNNTLAIVNGEARTTLSASDFSNDNKIVLLKDYDNNQITLGSCEVTGNLTKINALITGNEDIVLKNVHTSKITINNFTGNLTFDGGLLETTNVNNQNAAVQISTGYGSYTFKNMVVAANTNKALKISKAKSVIIDNCEFNASKLDSTVDTAGSYTARSLAAIDIQEQNAAAGYGKMTISITNCKFTDVPQGSTISGVKDSDTAGAIKIKTEKAERSAGFEKVTISGNTFTNCYRDVVVGCNVFQTPTSTKEQADMDAEGNIIQSPTWEIVNNTTTLTAEVVAKRGTLTYQATNKANSISEKVGRIEGGCAVWETARSARSWLN